MGRAFTFGPESSAVSLAILSDAALAEVGNGVCQGYRAQLELPMPYSEYRPDLMGSASLTPMGSLEAGSLQSLMLVYTAGAFGIDDTGSIKVGFRFATDFGPVQFTDPKAQGYTTVEASNGATLEAKWEFKRNIRP